MLIKARSNVVHTASGVHDDARIRARVTGTCIVRLTWRVSRAGPWARRCVSHESDPAGLHFLCHVTEPPACVLAYGMSVTLGSVREWREEHLSQERYGIFIPRSASGSVTRGR